MDTEVSEKVKQLPPDKQKVAEDFIDYLISKYKVQEKQNGESIAEMRKKNMGRLKGQIWMADDFNETPEDFKDYL